MKPEDIGKRINYWMMMNGGRVLVFDGIYQGEFGSHYRIYSNGKVQEVLKTCITRIEIQE